MMDDARIPNRHGSTPSVLVRRFEIYAGTLQPGASALVKRVVWDGLSEDPDPRYTTLDSDNLVFTVWSTFNRSFGQIGEQGWAIFYADSGRWEVISMEASLQRHGRPTTDVAKGSAGNFTIYYNNAGTETSTGITISVRCLVGAVTAADDHMIWYEPVSKLWYLVGGGGSGEVLVTIDKESPGNNPGDLIGPNASGAFKGFFTTLDPASSLIDDTNYVNGTPCWVSVVNKTTGAVAAVGQLPVYERYIGHLNGSKTIDDDARPLVLVHREENYCYNVTIGASDIASLASETFTLPDGRVITATNWSGSVASANDKVVVLHVWPNGTWIFIDPSPGSDSGAIVTVYTANADGSCLWDGHVAVPAGGASYCVDDQFPNGGACHIVVLNSATGSAGSKDPLTPGEHYIGRQVGSISGVPVYAIRADASDALLRFELLQDLNLGTATTAYVIVSVAGAWVRSGQTIIVSDNTRLNWEGLGGAAGAAGFAGARGWARKMADSGSYEIVWMEHTAQVIDYSQTGGDNTPAQISGYYQGRNPDPQGLGAIDIVDPGSFFPRVLPGYGADGIAIFSERANDYRRINANQIGLFYLAALTQPLAASTPLATFAAGLRQMNFSPFGLVDQSVTKAANTLLLSGKVGDPIVVAWDEGAGNYIVIATPQAGSGVWHISYPTSSSPVDAGQQGQIVIPGVAGNSTFTNWGNGTISGGDLIVVFRDAADGLFYAVGSGRSWFSLGSAVDGAPQGAVFHAFLFVDGQQHAVLNIGLATVSTNNYVIAWKNSAGDYEGFATPRDGIEFIEGFHAPVFPYAVLAATPVDGGTASGEQVLTATINNETFRTQFLVNGPALLAAGERGMAQGGPIVLALRSAVDPNLLTGSSWGPKPGSILMWPGYPGFRLHTEGDNLLGPGLAAFYEVPITKLLIRLNVDFPNDDLVGGPAEQAYSILVGDALNPTDGGWTEVPPLYNRTGATIPAGTICYAVWINGSWEALTFSAQSTFLGTLGGPLTFATPTVAIRGVPGCSSANNPMHYSAAYGAPVFVSKMSGVWQIMGVEQSRIGVVDNVQLEGNNEVQYRKNIVGMVDDTPEPTPIWSGSQVTTVTNIVWDGTSQTMTKRFVLSPGPPGAANVEQVFTTALETVVTTVFMSGFGLYTYTDAVRVFSAQFSGANLVFLGAPCPPVG